MTDETLPELIAMLEQQERRLVFSRFDNGDAWRLGCLLVELGTQRDLPIAGEIGGGAQQGFHAAPAGSWADSVAGVAGKVRVVERFVCS